MTVRFEECELRYVSWAGHGGYELAAQGYLRALVRAGVSVEWVPLFAAPGGWEPAVSASEAVDRVAALAGPRGDEGGDYGEWVRDLIGARVDPAVTVVHTIPETWPDHGGRDGTTIGITVWETDRLPWHWPDLLRQVDGLVVPSQFNADVFARAELDMPITVVPHVLPSAAPTPTREMVDAFRSRHGIASDHRIVYCTDAWNPRKAPWRTVATFLRAFGRADPVTLVLKTSPAGPRSAVDTEDRPTAGLVRELVGRCADSPAVVVIDEKIPAAEMDVLHHIGDCYLSLSHGEGFGLGPFHAAAAGNPVVVAGWGAPIEYLSPDWPYLLDYDLVAVMNVKGLPSYDPSQRWASPDADQAVELLRAVVADPDAAAERVGPHAVRIRREYSIDVIGPRFVRAVL